MAESLNRAVCALVDRQTRILRGLRGEKDSFFGSRFLWFSKTAINPVKRNSLLPLFSSRHNFSLILQDLALALGVAVRPGFCFSGLRQIFIRLAQA